MKSLWNSLSRKYLLLGPSRMIALAVILSGIFIIAWIIRLDKLIIPRKSSGPPEKITLAAYAGSYGFLPFIAQERGFFKNNGLDCTIREYDYGLNAADALIDGKADIATADDFVLTSYGVDHDDLRTIGSIARSRTDEIVYRTDHGIGQPKDLKGRKVGVSPKTKGEFFLARFLILNGMDSRDVVIVHLESARIVEALAQGTIDAASIREPFVSGILNRLGETHPGIQGFGISKVLEPAELQAHVAHVGAEGFPDYTVRPRRPA